MANYNSIIPIMTSNSQNGFTVSATSVNTAPYKALDGISDGTSYYRSSISPTLPEYFTVTFPRKYKVARYTLYLGYYNTQYVNMSTWEFQGLVNGVWTTLHSGSNTQTANTLTFDITPTDVDAIRIKCNSRHGTNSWGFDELVVYEIVYTNKILIQSSDEDIKSMSYIDKDVIPKMTSDTSPEGMASVSSINDVIYSAWKAFNKSNTTNTDCWASATGQTTGWIKYQFTTPKIIRKYAITSRNYDHRGDPKSWTFEGSNDGVNWTVLDIRTNESNWLANERREYSFQNNNSYTYYRLNISSVYLVGYSNWISIGELEMMEVYPIFVEITSPVITEQDFINHGMDKSTVLDLSQTISRKSFIEKNTTTLGSGKVFSKSIDTTKLPIKKLVIK